MRRLSCVSSYANPILGDLQTKQVSNLCAPCQPPLQVIHCLKLTSITYLSLSYHYFR